jgi:hypothetical protein
MVEIMICSGSIGVRMQNRGDGTILIRKRCENNSLASGIR